ncbi:hypothetical protein [Nonomuraea sp. SYSU D8015]|uniref:hypothetical protein n=1 Tax=Nonomuraea sp. SYSU D8015 TaxID=2593644 RepID=UPI0016614AD1|nr:hypothetical protein [Nonomuraea sp. SYSU D8015]
MSDRDLTVYRSTHPDALTAWHTAADARQEWTKQMQAFLDEHGFGKRTVYVGHSGRVLGIEHVDGEDAPDGWRVDQRTGYLMPRLKTRAGKQIDARLAELVQPDPRNKMPGMPMQCFVSLALLTCGMRIIRDTLYAEWSRPIPQDQVDSAIWQRIKLSEYYAAREADEAVAEPQNGGEAA